LKLVDVNVLVYAFREDARDHASYRAWLEDLVSGNEAYAASEIVLSGFVRIVTHRRIFPIPTPVSAALRFVETYKSQPNCVLVTPGSRHWEMAIESGCEWITADRDYARFPGLRWRHPLARA
jgi:hypothetical protein